MKKFKKISSFLIAMVLSFCMLSINTSALTELEPLNNDNMILLEEVTEDLGDGLTLITSTYEEVIPPSGFTAFSTTTTKSHKRTQTVKSDTQTLFSFTLTATFSINSGISATCTSASYSHTISNDSWSLYSASASKSGATGKATGLFKKKLLFIVVESLELNLTLKCDKNGNIT